MKNMRIFLMLGIAIISIGLTGCTNSGQDMSFQDAYNKLFSAQKIEDYMQKIYNDKAVSEKTSTDIAVSMDDGFLLSGNILTDSIYDTNSGNAEIGFGFKGGAYIPTMQSTFTMDFSGKLQTANQKLYLYIDAFGLQPGANNQQSIPEIGFIAPVVNTLAKQWIDLSPESNSGLQELSGINLVPYTANIKQFFIAIQHAIKTYSLFQEKSKTQIDGKLAYEIAWNPAGVSGFVTEILQNAKNLGKNIEITSGDIQNAIDGILKTTLSGYIIVYSEDNVVLRIDSLKTEDAGTFSANLSTKNGATFQLLSTTGSLVLTGNIERQRNNNVVNITVPDNNIKINIQIPDGGKSFAVNIIGSGFTAHIITQGEVKPLDSYIPTTISTSKPIQDIINGLMGLFGGETNNITNEDNVTTSGVLTLPKKQPTIHVEK